MTVRRGSYEDAASLRMRVDGPRLQRPGFAFGNVEVARAGPGRVEEMWNRKKIRHETPIDGRFLALGGRGVNSRGSLLFSEQADRRKKMKRGMTVLAVLFVFSISAFAEMSNRQGGGMINGGWWWGMNTVWYSMVVIAVLIIAGIYLIMKRER